MKDEYEGAIEVSIVFHEGNRMFAVPKHPAPVQPVAYMHEWEDGERIAKMHGRDHRHNDQPKTVRPLMFADTTPPAQPAPVQEPVASMSDEQDAFEKVFKLPDGITRFDGGYAPTSYSAWSAQQNCYRWEGWKARSKLCATPPAAPVQPVASLFSAIQAEPVTLIHKWRVLELVKDYTTPPAAPVQEPLFWYKPHPNGMYNGPIHNAQIGDVLRGSEEWIPLYTTPPPAEFVCSTGLCHYKPAAPDLQAELDATNRQVEILSDALAESRREVAALKAVQEPWKPSDTAHRPGGLPQDFTTHEVESFDEWSEWVNPYSEQYFMKCCDCGLVHEMQFKVAKYSEGDECAFVEDADLQAVFRARRATPPQRSWVGLTDEEWQDLSDR
jgi:hypothetical protein